jgi:hypothetical protein
MTYETQPLRCSDGTFEHVWLEEPEATERTTTWRCAACNGRKHQYTIDGRTTVRYGRPQRPVQEVASGTNSIDP